MVNCIKNHIHQTEPSQNGKRHLGWECEMRLFCRIEIKCLLYFRSSKLTGSVFASAPAVSPDGMPSNLYRLADPQTIGLSTPKKLTGRLNTVIKYFVENLSWPQILLGDKIHSIRILSN
jgi:hypothetical protein